MLLYLVQHGQSLPKDQDPGQPLSPEGIETVEKIAQIAKDHGLVVSSIKHSGKERAKGTAEIFEKYLSPEKGVQQIEGIAPMDEVSSNAIHELIEGNSNLMLVGHLPFMERLTSYLVTGDTDKTILKFQNGGIVCLKKEDEKDWIIGWTISPTCR